MATLKDIQRKIGAVKKTQKITKAMNMVAASKLRGAQDKMEAFRPYADKFAEVLGSLAERIEADEEHLPPLLASREEVKTIDLVLMTSDRGLCGSFNSNLIARAEKFMREKADQGIETRLICMGRKGRDYFRRRKYNILSDHIGIVGARFAFNVAVSTGQGLIDSFLGEETDEVHMLFSQFVSMARQVPTVAQLLPIAGVKKAEEALEAAEQEVGYVPEHICEPPAEELMAEMLPRQVFVQLFRGLLETSTSEHAARMQAMDNATSNCADMITSLTLVYNKARQAAITAELMDIVGGAEALKG
jgi:F-type H+-transporting ATPase subunit gamma